jgi:hypothetical protein
MTEAVTYSPIVGAQKAVKNSFIQAIIWGLTALILNWNFVLSLLPEWKNLTIGGALLIALNFILNWLKNRNPN